MSEQQVSKIMKRFRQARDKRIIDRDPIWKELDAFDRGQQWQLASHTASWTPKPVTNFIHLVKYTKRAAMALENPVGLLSPNSPLDMEKITQLDKIYKHEWKKMNLRQQVRNAIETSKLLGTAIIQLSYDGEHIGGGTLAKYEGRIVAKEVDPLNKVA